MYTLVIKILIGIFGLTALLFGMAGIGEHSELVVTTTTTTTMTDPQAATTRDPPTTTIIPPPTDPLTTATTDPQIDTTDGVHRGYCGYEPTYTDDEYRWFAQHSDILILHENHKDQIDFIRSINPGIILLCYKFAGVDKTGGVGCCGDFTWIDENHPDWFLLDRDGNRITDHFNKYSRENAYYMDYGDPEFRDYFTGELIGAVKGQGWDGIFLDGMYVNIEDYRASNGLLGYENDEEFNEAVTGFLSAMYFRFKEAGMLLIPNACECVNVENFWQDWLSFTDGGLDEGFSSVSFWSPSKVWRTEREWERQITYLEYTGNQDKIFYATSQGRWLNERDLAYNLASYLIGKSGRGDVFYNAGYNDDGDVCTYSRIKEDWEFFRDYYTAPIGTPLGGRYKSQGVWQRDYSGGRVLVNPSYGSYFVMLGGEYNVVGGMENTVVTNITLGGHEGMILLNY